MTGSAERQFARPGLAQLRSYANQHRFGLASSIAVHLLVLSFMLLGLAAQPYGQPGEASGMGISVSLVDGLPTSGPATKLNKPTEIEQAAPDASDRPISTEQIADAALPSVAPSEPRPSDLVSPPVTPASAPAGQAGGGGAEAAQVTLTGGDSAAGGDPTAMGDLLAQIARCLPPGSQPKLGFSRIVVEVGEDGALKAAPHVDSALPMLSAQDRLAADQVVQAALQCGPYDKPAFKNRVMSLVADFSAVQPAVVAANLSHAGVDAGRR